MKILNDLPERKPGLDLAGALNQMWKELVLKINPEAFAGRWLNFPFHYGIYDVKSCSGFERNHTDINKLNLTDTKTDNSTSSEQRRMPIQ